MVQASHCGGFFCCGTELQGTQASVDVARGLRSYVTQAELVRGMWDLPGPGIEPVCPALPRQILFRWSGTPACHQVMFCEQSCLKVYSWCIRGERCTPCPPMSPPSCTPHKADSWPLDHRESPHQRTLKVTRRESREHSGSEQVL